MSRDDIESLKDLLKDVDVVYKKIVNKHKGMSKLTFTLYWLQFKYQISGAKAILELMLKEIEE